VGINIKDGIPGYIAAKEVDIYHRIVGFVFPENVSFHINEGKYQTLSNDMAKESANYGLLSEGLAYPSFYTGLPGYIRDAWADESREARSELRGLWAIDKTNDGFSIYGDKIIEDLELNIAVYPELFRKTVAFLAQDPDKKEFYSYFYSLEDYVVHGDRCQIGKFAEFVSFNKNDGLVKLRYEPEKIIFISK